MKISKLEITEHGDIVYFNNKGKPFLLTEAVNPRTPGTYDIIVAFSGQIDENGYFCWNSTDVVWWFGAFDLSYYFKDSSEDSILRDCADYLDEN